MLSTQIVINYQTHNNNLVAQHIIHKPKILNFIYNNIPNSNIQNPCSKSQVIQSNNNFFNYKPRPRQDAKPWNFKCQAGLQVNKIDSCSLSQQKNSLSQTVKLQPFQSLQANTVSPIQLHQQPGFAQKIRQVQLFSISKDHIRQKTKANQSFLMSRQENKLVQLKNRSLSYGLPLKMTQTKFIDLQQNNHFQIIKQSNVTSKTQSNINALPHKSFPRIQGLRTSVPNKMQQNKGDSAIKDNRNMKKDSSNLMQPLLNQRARAEARKAKLKTVYSQIEGRQSKIDENQPVIQNKHQKVNANFFNKSYTQVSEPNSKQQGIAFCSFFQCGNLCNNEGEQIVDFSKKEIILYGDPTRKRGKIFSHKPVKQQNVKQKECQVNNKSLENQSISFREPKTLFRGFKDQGIEDESTKQNKIEKSVKSVPNTDQSFKFALPQAFALKQWQGQDISVDFEDLPSFICEQWQRKNNEPPARPTE